MKAPRLPYIVTGVAFLVCLCVTALAACSDLPDSIPEIPPLQTAAPAPSPTLEPAPAATLTPPVATPTPIPTVPPGASTIILRLSIAPADTQTPYDRDDWKSWIDADGDCQNTRHEVLISESTIATEFRDSRQCQVVTGSWADPFTARVFTDPRDLDVDHMVPLANAHRSGGHAWDGERKRQYANHLAYEGHLVAVSRSANRSKGSRGPDEWRPPNQDYWCQYALDWATIKREWDLTATQSEADALSEMLDTCDTRIYIQAERRQAARIEPTPTPDPTPSPRTAPPTQTPVALSLPAPSPPTQVPVTSSLSAPSPPTQTPVTSSPPTPIPPTQTPATPTALPTQTPSPTPFPTPTPIPTPTPTLVEFPKPSPDRNCSDFTNWSEAQAFFVSHGGPESDPYKLDPDGNGVPCQSIVGAPSNPPIEDRDCSDFDTWSEAQAFYEEHGGPYSDPHNLDRDSDGIACQSLRDAANTPTPTSGRSEARSRDTHNCSDFDTWSEAQSFYESEGGPASDPHRLDRDSDGVACQSLPGALGDDSASNSSAEPAPTPSTAPIQTAVPPTPTLAETPAPTPTPAAPTPTAAPASETFQDRNCSDFDTWSEAQSFYESEGGPGSDPHRLDGNNDGIACQSLPGAPEPESTPTPVSTAPTPTATYKSEDTHNCSDFDTWREAQSFYESEGGPDSDPHKLDGNDDGVACQSLPGAPKPEPTPTPTPGDANSIKRDRIQMPRVCYDCPA